MRMGSAPGCTAKVLALNGLWCRVPCRDVSNNDLNGEPEAVLGVVLSVSAAQLCSRGPWGGDAGAVGRRPCCEPRLLAVQAPCPPTGEAKTPSSRWSRCEELLLVQAVGT